MSEPSVWQLYFSIEQQRSQQSWFEGGRISYNPTDIEGKNLSRAFFHGGYLQGARLIRCDLSESDISSGDLEDAEIIQCIWDDALLRGTHFDRSLIQDCRVVAAYLGIAHFIETQVKGGNWSKTDFDRSTWTNAKLENACFQKANFRSARLKSARFLRCDFGGANLLATITHHTVFEHCNFQGAYLQGLSLKNTVFYKCNFYNCVGIPEIKGDCEIIEPDLSEAFDSTLITDKKQLFVSWGLDEENAQTKTTACLHPLPEWKTYIGYENRASQAHWVNSGCIGTPPINLHGKNLSQAFAYKGYFRYAHLVECDLTACDLRRAEFHQAKFIDCVFDQALMMNVLGKETLFQNCKVNKANLNRCELENAKLVGGDWSKSEFNNCHLQLSSVENICFAGSSLRWADLRGTHFINCDFRFADLTNANLIGSTFEYCDFRDCDISWAKIKRTTFKECNFYNVIGTVSNWDFESNEKSFVIKPNLSENFDDTAIIDSTFDAKQFFEDLRKQQTS